MTAKCNVKLTFTVYLTNCPLLILWWHWHIKKPEEEKSNYHLTINRIWCRKVHLLNLTILSICYEAASVVTINVLYIHDGSVLTWSFNIVTPSRSRSANACLDVTAKLTWAFQEGTSPRDLFSHRALLGQITGIKKPPSGNVSLSIILIHCSVLISCDCLWGHVSE